MRKECRGDDGMDEAALGDVLALATEAVLVMETVKNRIALVRGKRYPIWTASRRNEKRRQGTATAKVNEDSYCCKWPRPSRTTYMGEM